MSKLLEELPLGTSVFVGEQQVGDVRGIYSLGDSKLAEYLNVYWSTMQTELLVPTTEVRDIEVRGVVLQGPIETYADLARFDEPSRPDITRLR
ncbi:MAG: hypothetical protein M3126_10160 [Candidatus Eremiobacteraeota bacterium]|nr:hypothetical protein [Candidatus Eremiobacteraeota bacterium]